MPGKLRNYYDILGVPPDAGPEDIQTAYRQLVRQYHPDVNPTIEATHRMQEINEAYTTLRDPASRARYDQARVPTTGPETAVGERPAQIPSRFRVLSPFTILFCWLVILGLALVVSRFTTWLAQSYRFDDSSASSAGFARATAVILPPLPATDIARNSALSQQTPPSPPFRTPISLGEPSQGPLPQSTPEVNQPDTVPSPSATPFPEVSTTGDVMIVSRRYEAGDRWEVRVQKVLYTSQISSASGLQVANATWRFAAVFLAVTNRGTAAGNFVIQSDTLEVQDAYDRLYEVDELATAYAQEQYHTSAGLSVTPNDTVSMVGVWDVAPHGDAYWLVPGSLVAPGASRLPLP